MKTAGALINRGIVSARFCYITAFVIFVFTAFCTSTEASSYTRGDVRCDVVLKLGSVNELGAWKYFDVKFYDVIDGLSKINNIVSFHCKATNTFSDKFFCYSSKSGDLLLAKKALEDVEIKIPLGTYNAQYSACKQIDEHFGFEVYRNRDYDKPKTPCETYGFKYLCD